MRRSAASGGVIGSQRDRRFSFDFEVCFDLCFPSALFAGMNDVGVVS